MTRKGALNIAELRIREAIHRGELKDLPGEGKPLELRDLDGLSHDQRIEALLMRSLGDVPEEVRLLKQLAELSEARKASEDHDERAALRRRMHTAAVRLSVLFEKAGRNLSAADVIDRFLGRPGDADPP